MFEPYHNFTNCKKLRRLIRNLQENNNISPALLEDHKKYHFAVFHKLKSTQHYTDKLASVLSNPTLALAPESDFFPNVNRNLDGFFHCGGGTLDILAREILTYFGISLSQNVYFDTARTKLNQQRPNDSIIRHLQEPSWKEKFSTYRNACTHELLILGHYSINVDEHGGVQTKTIILPLPDDPRSVPSQRTYRNHPDALVYCKKTLKRLLSLINVIYGDLADKIATKNSMPL